MKTYKRLFDYCLGLAVMAAMFWYSFVHLQDPLSLTLAKAGAVPLFLLAGRAVTHALGGESHTSATFRSFERHVLYGLVWGSFWIIANWSDGVTVQQAGRFFAAFFIGGLSASIVMSHTKRRENG